MPCYFDSIAKKSNIYYKSREANLEYQLTDFENTTVIELKSLQQEVGWVKGPQWFKTE